MAMQCNQPVTQKLKKMPRSLVVYVPAHHTARSRETKQCSRNRYAELARDAALCCCRSWVVEGIPYKTPSNSQERESERTHLWCPICPLCMFVPVCSFVPWARSSHTAHTTTHR